MTPLQNVLGRERVDDRYYADRAPSNYTDPMAKRLMAKIEDRRWLRRRERRIRRIARRVRRMEKGN